MMHHFLISRLLYLNENPSTLDAIRMLLEHSPQLLDALDSDGRSPLELCAQVSSAIIVFSFHYFLFSLFSLFLSCFFLMQSILHVIKIQNLDYFKLGILSYILYIVYVQIYLLYVYQAYLYVPVLYIFIGSIIKLKIDNFCRMS